MIRINCTGKDFAVEAPAYRLEFSAQFARAVLHNTATGRVAATISFAPVVNGAALADFVVEKVLAAGQDVEIACRGGGRGIGLSMSFADGGLVYSFSFDAQGLTNFSPGAFDGDFFQVCNFTPDMPRIDVTRRVVTAFQVSSRKAKYDKFFQLDGGNYMIPPYLLALYDCRYYLGVGLLDVPDTSVAMDLRVTANRAELGFDYSVKPKSGRYVSPRVGLYLADSPTGILKAYRRSLPQPSGEPKPQPAWWREPIYTTWGDQVYAKGIEEGRMTAEAGSESYLSADRIDAALEKLKSRDIRPGTIVIDEGWSKVLGDWDADNAKFSGSLAEYIRDKHSRGYRIVLHFNPFQVRMDSSLAMEHPDFLLRDEERNLRKVSRSGRDYYLLDWSNAAARRFIAAKIAAMVSSTGLDADGLKVSGVKFLPGDADCPADPGYGTGERYLLAVLEDIHRAVKAAKAEAPIYLACLNPLFAHCFDIVRLGNTSEVNHDVYVQRAETASWLMPDKLVDTDDWASFAKVLGATTFLKALAGVPNIFSAFYRGDGRLKVQGAPGGHPLKMTDEQYRIVSAAWKLYDLSKDADRSELRVDFDRMEFSTRPGGDGRPWARTYQGGNTLAVYRGGEIFLASLLDGKVIIDMPQGFQAAMVERIDRAGRRESVSFRKCLGEKIVFEARSSRDETYCYHICSQQRQAR